MKKYILLSSLIIITAFAYAMEKESSCPCNQISHESEVIQNLRKEKNNFETQLTDDTWEQNKTGYNSDLKLSRFWSDDFNPLNFFRSCYYKFHHKMTILKFKLPGSLLDTYKDTQIDGYSALGAAILAKDISHDAKLNFIQNLINFDFKPTTKDIELAKLYVYDSNEIHTYKDILVHVLQSNPKSHWSMLPYDVKEQIVRLLVQFFKKDTSWILPEKIEQQENDVTYCIHSEIIRTI